MELDSREWKFLFALLQSHEDQLTDVLAQWAKTWKKVVHFGRTIHCLPLRTTGEQRKKFPKKWAVLVQPLVVRTHIIYCTFLPFLTHCVLVSKSKHCLKSLLDKVQESFPRWKKKFPCEIKRQKSLNNI